MNCPRMAIGWGVLILAIALGDLARGGEITVVGSPWRGRPAPKSGGTILLAKTISAENNAPLPPNDQETLTGEPVVDDSTSPMGEVLVEPAPRLFTCSQHPLEANWYTRFDYFLWKEVEGSRILLNENGTIYNVGYLRSAGAQRFRAELFGGNVHYGGATWGGEPLDSTTTYLGFRAEYQWVWDIHFRDWATPSVFAGIGTRFWIRDLKDGQLSDGRYSSGYQETWWTFYPYIGMEKTWTGIFGDELFLSGRLGATSFTFEDATMLDSPTLHPKPGITGQVELGLRSEHFCVSAYFEAMTWKASADERGVFQPDSQMYTTGVKLGLYY